MDKPQSLSFSRGLGRCCLSAMEMFPCLVKEGGWKVLWNVPIPICLLGLLGDESVGLVLWGLLLRAVLCFRVGYSACLEMFPPRLLPCAMISLCLTVCA